MTRKPSCASRTARPRAARRLRWAARALIADADNPLRLRFLEESADQEAVFVLKRAYRSYRGLTESETVRRLLRGHVSARRPAGPVYPRQRHTGGGAPAAGAPP